jgi:S-formylglutathione hydrolase
MGGNGSLMIAARNPDLYKSVSAFAPICSLSNPNSQFNRRAMKAYFGDNLENAKKYDCVHAIQHAAVVPVGLIDFGTADEYMEDLEP